VPTRRSALNLLWNIPPAIRGDTANVDAHSSIRVERQLDNDKPNTVKQTEGEKFFHEPYVCYITELDTSIKKWMTRHTDAHVVRIVHKGSYPCVEASFLHKYI